MELRDLEYFAVVAEHGHLGRAAEALGLSHPALSKSLRRLEMSAEAKLVKRTPKGVELTPEGHALLSHVGALRLSISDIRREISDLGQGRVGRLRIGIGPGISVELLAGTCGPLLGQAAQLKFEITVATNDVLMPALGKGEYDLIISGIPGSPHEGLVQEPLYEDEFAVLASVRHRLARRRKLSITDIARESWAMSAPDTLSWRELHRRFEDHGLPPPLAALQANSIAVRLNAVSCSSLLCFESTLLARQSARQLFIVELPVKDMAWLHRAGVSYRKSAYLSPATRRFIEELKAKARKLVEEGRGGMRRQGPARLRSGARAGTIDQCRSSARVLTASAIPPL